MKTARILTLILALVALGMLAAYAQEVKQETASAPAQTAQAGSEHDHGTFKEKRFVATVGADGVQHVEIMGGSYYFDPNYIIVKANVPVELSVKKEGYTPHDIVVKAPEAGIDFEQSLDRKTATAIKFTPTKPGKYEMYCSKKVPFTKSHKERGMDGMIEVVP